MVFVGWFSAGGLSGLHMNVLSGSAVMNTCTLSPNTLTNVKKPARSFLLLFALTSLCFLPVRVECFLSKNVFCASLRVSEVQLQI